MPKQKQLSSFHTRQVSYYAGRVLQRLSLLVAAASTVTLWGSLLAISHGFVFTNSLQGAHLTHLDELNLGISNEVNKLAYYAMACSVIALVFTLAMLVFPRVVKYEKKLVVDGVVIASFLFVFAACSQAILQSLLSHIAG